MKNNIGNTKNTIDLINQHDFFIKKHYGQNFLVDQNILTNIVDKAEITKDIGVIEIGPGLGALTQHLLKKASKVLCYEIDKTLIPILNKNFQYYDNFTLINEDILKVDINEDINKYLGGCKTIYLVANLPYYITTPIILNLLQQTSKIKRYVMMMQLEVANRICAKPSVKDYNALSIVIQYKANATKVLDVPRSVFIPKPNVDSCVIKLDLYEEKKYTVIDEDLFYKIIRLAFAQRRKTLINNLSSMLDKDKIVKVLEKLGLKSDIRAEALSINDFIDLVNELT